MQLLDDAGRLFGVVNVVDALAALLFVSLLVAGVAVVGGFGDSGEAATRYATVEFGTQPAYAAESISVGDRSSVGPAAGNLTVTDLFVTGGNGSASATVYARVAVEGRLVERRNRTGTAFTYADRPLPVGSSLAFTGDDYTLDSRVTALAGDGESLDTATLPTRAETTVPVEVADAVSVGDEYRLAGRTVATVTDVRSYPTTDPARRFLSLGLDLRTVADGGTQRFAGEPVTLGSTVPFRTDAYVLDASVVRRGDDTPSGESVTTGATVSVESVDPAVAAELGPGVTETVDGTTLATVTAVTSENATVVVQSEGGEIFAREHPVLEAVTVSVDLATRRTESGLRFHGRSLTVGGTVTLDFGTVRVTGTVTGVER
jgi:hypothetical protein